VEHVAGRLAQAYHDAMTTRELRADPGVDYELVRFVRRARAYAIEHLEAIHPELDYNTFVILLAVHDAPEGVRASDLVGELFVHKSTISRAVSNLERLGLLDRVTHPNDGRAQLLTVPKSARERIEAFRTGSFAWLGSLLEDWSADEVQTFARQLSRLNDAAEKK
jgi:DNA-binding MarR family transcriptional regulator